MIFYIILCLLPVVLFFLLHPDRVSGFYIFIVSALAFLIFSFTTADYERRIRKNRHIKKRLQKPMEKNQTDSVENQLKKITKALRKKINKNIHKSLFKLKGYFFMFNVIHGSIIHHRCHWYICGSLSLHSCPRSFR